MWSEKSSPSNASRTPGFQEAAFSCQRITDRLCTDPALHWHWPYESPQHCPRPLLCISSWLPPWNTGLISVRLTAAYFLLSSHSPGRNQGAYHLTSFPLLTSKLGANLHCTCWTNPARMVPPPELCSQTVSSAQNGFPSTSSHWNPAHSSRPRVSAAPVLSSWSFLLYSRLTLSSPSFVLMFIVRTSATAVSAFCHVL